MTELMDLSTHQGKKNRQRQQPKKMHNNIEESVVCVLAAVGETVTVLNTHLAVFMINHHIMWLHISMHDSHAVAVVQGLHTGAKGLYYPLDTASLFSLPSNYKTATD